MSEEGKRLSRRELLKKAGAGAVAVGAAGAGAPFAFAGPHKYTGRWLSGNLSAITWVHFVPSYDQWLDPWAKQWGEQNDVQVTIDHINNTLLDTRAAAEVAAQSGHDLFFATFGLFNAAWSGRTGDVLADVIARAGAQNEIYLELMYGLDRGAAGRLADRVGWD